MWRFIADTLLIATIIKYTKKFFSWLFKPSEYVYVKERDYTDMVELLEARHKDNVKLRKKNDKLQRQCERLRTATD